MEKRLKQSKYKTLVRFDDGIEIRADPLCWVLYIPSPRTYWFYSTLDQLFTDLLNLKIKEFASKDTRKTIQSLAEAIHQANAEIREIIDNLTSIESSALRRLEMQEGPESNKND